MQYMTTEDVQFNPLQPTRMASCGADGIVQLWDCDQIIEDNMLLPVRAVPLDNCKAKTLAYKPDGCALAVSAFDGNIYVQQDSAERSSSITLPLGRDADHTTTDMIWGRKSSSHILYATSASCSIQEMAGCHKAFDTNSGGVICELDAQEAGQRLAVNEIGDTIVLATKGQGMSFCLRKYDARRRLGRAVERTMLEPFTGEGSHKVNYMAFSPDGVYIAIARTDNTAHVYDARFLGKDVLHVFAHEDGSNSQSGRHGVITAQWIDGFPRGLGLVTGGADGCIRLWDVRRSTDDPFNGTPIAECDYGIGDFVTGDIGKGEHPLIVGECSGQVNVFR
ncbi:WD40 repeat-like protein [Laetiporus sulphureus 93-53]|uniref:WD40 repeat-like protein n=1 Tax=Laetiporus sulphureus 93-53 TaxID=1314785 RepID=A0A165EEL9_9APHY|nr:WD40 repeat-like protein [Laetiporus sulphureus 93-53]KZT06889.1 WD40 repeat-like protein [Laetiporus sulphureus 93-53]